MKNSLDIIPQLYSELTEGNPDFIDLAERCELLTQILLDCKTLAQYQPVCRCLISYLGALKQTLEEDMSDFRILELTVDHELPEEQGWLMADSDIQCAYCHVTAVSLLKTNDDADAATLAGLLHDLVSYMTSELKAPRFTTAQPQTA